MNEIPTINNTRFNALIKSLIIAIKKHFTSKQLIKWINSSISCPCQANNLTYNICPYNETTNYACSINELGCKESIKYNAISKIFPYLKFGEYIKSKINIGEIN